MSVQILSLFISLLITKLPFVYLVLLFPSVVHCPYRTLSFFPVCYIPEFFLSRAFSASSLSVDLSPRNELPKGPRSTPFPLILVSILTKVCFSNIICHRCIYMCFISRSQLMGGTRFWSGLTPLLTFAAVLPLHYVMHPLSNPDS